MMERLETGETDRPSRVSVSDILTSDSGTEQVNRSSTERRGENLLGGGNTQPTRPAGSASC